VTLPDIRGRWPLVLVAGVFLLRGAGRLAAWDYTVPSFAVWGYPAWVAALVATLEILGGVLIVATPRWRAGAVLLALAAGGLVATHWVFADGWRAVASDLLPLLALGIAVALRLRSGPRRPGPDPG
jgi:uncharacterized membrane protein YphA (DoxX/SURF4 family)